jgi:hypothetical protein
MPNLVYPPSLPGPAYPWQQQRVERRMLRALREPANAARARSRDPVVMVPSATWTYSAAEMEYWRVWFEGAGPTQAARLRWFSAVLPGRGGLIARVARYMAAPERALLGNGLWRVTAPLCIRGAGVAPQQDATVEAPESFELREGGDFELREADTFELRG